MTEALYSRDGDRFLPTDLVTSPWSAEASHGGPPAALLARALEGVDPPDLRLARITVELLGPIPLVPLRTEARIAKEGRRVQLVEATLVGPESRVLALARGWRLRVRKPPLALPVTEAAPQPLPSPHTTAPSRFRFRSWRHFPVDAQELRHVAGELDGPGRAVVWTRFLVPLVAGEVISPAQRVVATVDSMNGISGHAPPDDWLYVNPDLTVHLQREPVGEWIGMDARSHWDPAGGGLAEAMIFDEAGFLGRGAQTLLVEPQPTI